MALQDMREQIITEIGNRDDLNSVIDDQINYALQEISTMFPFKELQQTATTSTVNTQFEYPLPTDLFALWSVKDETTLNRNLVYKDIKDFDQIDESQTGQPFNWTHWQNSLLLFNQVPDTTTLTIRIRYWRIHPTLSNNTDTIVLPDRMERGIRLKATAYVFGILNQEDRQAQKEQEFVRWLSNQKMPVAESKGETKRARANMVTMRSN